MAAETTKLLTALRQLTETGDAGARLAAETLPNEERELAGLLNRIIEKQAERSANEAKSLLDSLNHLLNNLDALIMATVPETGEILFVNDRFKAIFDVDGDGVGQCCYKYLYGYFERCSFCPYHTFKLDETNVAQWEFRHPKTDRVHRMTGMLMDWPGRGRAHLEFGVEITDSVRHQKMLENILNSMDALITLADPETFEILFINDSIRAHFGIEGDGVGQTCYKLLQKRDTPCTSCPHLQLRNEPDKTVMWEHREAVKGSILHKTAKLIDWVEGKKAHLEYAIDMTASKNMEKSIRKLELDVEKVYYDSLTGLYNRRYFEKNIERLIRSLARSGGVLSMMMVDIDQFKNYNDTYGHIVGDDCLKVVAETLQGCIMRKDDFVARYGGEEFVVVLPNTDEAGARKVADKMLHEVYGRNIPHENSHVANCVTISIGVVTGAVASAHKRDDFLKRADEMLYQSKQTGRNRYTHTHLLQVVTVPNKEDVRVEERKEKA